MEKGTMLTKYPGCDNSRSNLKCKKRPEKYSSGIQNRPENPGNKVRPPLAKYVELLEKQKQPPSHSGGSKGGSYRSPRANQSDIPRHAVPSYRPIGKGSTQTSDSAHCNHRNVVNQESRYRYLP